MKKYLLGIVVVGLAITFSAFSKPESPKALLGEKWFQLASGTDETVASNYSIIGDGDTAPSCTGSHVCAKLAVPDSQNEDIPNLGSTIDIRFRETP